MRASARELLVKRTRSNNVTLLNTKQNKCVYNSRGVGWLKETTLIIYFKTPIDLTTEVILV